MSKSKSNKSGPRMGTRMRGAMSEAYGARGHTEADLYLHYSQKLQRDVALTGQLAYFHFLLVERTPEVIAVDYAPFEKLSKLVGDNLAELVSAVVTTSDKRVIWRRLIDSEPDDAKFVEDLSLSIGKGHLSGVSHLEVLTFRELVAQEVWTRNAHRALAWIAAARDWPLTKHKQLILSELKRTGELTFQACGNLGHAGERALISAAVLQLALNGAIDSDLDKRPLSADSLFAARQQGC